MKYKVEEKVIKTFESFLGKSKWDQYQNLSKPQEGEVDMATRNSILDVNNFNRWLSEDYNYGGYNGAPGIVGRIDKLSYAMVVAYFLDQGVECTDQEIYDFQDKIRKTWNESR
jgi:hypothetical protein